MASLKAGNLYRSEIDDESFSTLLPSDGKVSSRAKHAWRRSLPSPTLKFFALLLLSFNLAQSFFFLYHYSRRGPANPIFPQMLYSPAQDILKYEAKVFDDAFKTGKEVSVYQQDPSEEVDQAWKELYNDVGILRIPKSSAIKLPNATYPFTNDPGHYIISLAVFHHLHCLNIIRQALNSDYYRQFYPESDFEEDDGALGRTHTGHCVEIIRQALICASDVSPIVWQWSEVAQKALPKANIVHTCRKFDTIHEWAVANKGVTKFVSEMWVEDEIQGR